MKGERKLVDTFNPDRTNSENSLWIGFITAREKFGNLKELNNPDAVEPASAYFEWYFKIMV